MSTNHHTFVWCQPLNNYISIGLLFLFLADVVILKSLLLPHVLFTTPLHSDYYKLSTNLAEEQTRHCYTPALYLLSSTLYYYQ